MNLSLSPQLTQKPAQAAAWYQQAIFYHIYPLGLLAAPERNDYQAAPVERLGQIKQWIPHLHSLGVNALYLGPLFESEAHGYDPVDFFAVDRRLGDNDSLRDLVQTLHSHGIRVILDAVLNHVSRDFFAFQDLLINQQNSPYIDWFMEVDFNKSSPYGDPFAYQGWSGHFNLVKLNLGNPAVVKHLLDAVSHWIDAFGIDGLRLDAADVMEPAFLKQLSAHTRPLKADFWLMGEVVHGDYRDWANPEMLHATTNYECYKGLYSSHNDRNYFELAHSLNRLFNSQDGLYRHLHLYNFADNHDLNRVASTLKQRAHLYPLYLLLYAMPGSPSIYYGSEWGLTGSKAHQSDAPLRPALDLAQLQQASAPDLSPELLPVLQRFGQIRQASEALQLGSYQQIHVAAEQIAFLRQTEHEQVLVVANSAEQSVQLELEIGGPDRTVRDLLNPADSFQIQAGKLRLEIPACWGRYIRL